MFKRSKPITFLAFLFVACWLLCGIAIAAPSITLSKKSGPPTSGILVSGRGFEPNVGVDIFFDTKDNALVVTNGKGEFHDARIHAPRSAHPGKHWVTALERNHDKGAQEPFLVETDWNQFHFDADGTRLNRYENVLSPDTVGNLDLKWSHSFGPIDSAIAVTDGVVYVGSDDNNLYALQASTGKQLWSYTTFEVVESSPTVANGVVYFGSDNVYALNASTGDKIWSYPAYGFSSPTVANGVLYVGSDDHNIYALNVSSGVKLWSYATGLYVRSSPAVTNGVAYVGSWDGSVYALDTNTGTLVWSYSTGGDVTSPTIADGVVYVGSYDDNVYALNARNGTKLWSYSTGGGVISSPAVANGVVYVGSGYPDYNLYALNARNGTKLWSYTTGASVDSSPAVANGVVYVGSNDGNVYALSARTGAILWRYTTDCCVYSPPTVVDGMVYVGTYGGTIYAFGLTHGEARRGTAKPRSASMRPTRKLFVPLSTSGSPRSPQYGRVGNSEASGNN
jgi:outer membrane protein assembly factor BamB